MTVNLPHSGVDFHPQPNPASVSRRVHYTSYDTEADTKACRAAVITVAEDEQGRVGLCVLNRGGAEFLTDVPAHHIDETDADQPRTTEGVQGRQPGTWHWPDHA